MKKEKTEEQIKNGRERARRYYYRHIDVAREKAREYQRAKRAEFKAMKEELEALRK